MKTSDFDYDLPPELIASHPPVERDASRMLVVCRRTGKIEHAMFRDLGSFLAHDDLLVFNDTRVVPARFFSNDGRIELLKVEADSELRWTCLVKPGKRMKVGATLEIGLATGTVVSILDTGERVILFDQLVDENAHGHLALPHYMEREDQPEDRERYQTVYARDRGAIAAPTAGLHFTKEMVNRFPHTFVTLHVGIGTFQPVRVEDVGEHRMHSEKFHLTASAAEQIEHAENVVAVGTTVVRVLEHCAQLGRPLRERQGQTDIFIHPPYEFQVIDRLITNFHLPRSTLLMLVSAFAGRELIHESYAKAVENRYRFFSYGDCMLIL